LLSFGRVDIHDTNPQNHNRQNRFQKAIAFAGAGAQHQLNLPPPAPQNLPKITTIYVVRAYCDVVRANCLTIEFKYDRVEVGAAENPGKKSADLCRKGH
jgi:hypothetical protein